VDPDVAASIGQLRWRCRRGTRELDELLSAYLARAYPGAQPDEQAAFRRLLDAQDADISDWCLGRRVPPDPALGALLERITALAGTGA
jgi:antitoxin CptB